MTEPSLKRLRLGFEQDDEQDLIQITQDFISNWDLFRLLASKLSLEELNRLCSLNRDFRVRCKNDPVIQRMKTKLIIQRKRRLTYNRQEDEELQSLYNFKFTDRNGHSFIVKGLVQPDFGSDFGSLVYDIEYIPNYLSYETADFNILYKDVIATIRRISPVIDDININIKEGKYNIFAMIYNQNINVTKSIFEALVNFVVKSALNKNSFIFHIFWCIAFK